jgi:hypothetical protein
VNSSYRALKWQYHVSQRKHIPRAEGSGRLQVVPRRRVAVAVELSVGVEGCTVLYGKVQYMYLFPSSMGYI